VEAETHMELVGLGVVRIQAALNNRALGTAYFGLHRRRSSSPIDRSLQPALSAINVSPMIQSFIQTPLEKANFTNEQNECRRTFYFQVIHAFLGVFAAASHVAAFLTRSRMSESTLMILRLDAFRPRNASSSN
jgi:hypothetical protein